jgi:hypothetical protein
VAVLAHRQWPQQGEGRSSKGRGGDGGQRARGVGEEAGREEAAPKEEGPRPATAPSASCAFDPGEPTRSFVSSSRCCPPRRFQFLPSLLSLLSLLDALQWMALTNLFAARMLTEIMSSNCRVRLPDEAKSWAQSGWTTSG